MTNQQPNNGNNGHLNADSGEHQNTSSLAPVQVAKAQPTQPKPTSNLSRFEQKVILKQTPLWSRAIMWTIVGVAGFGILWASFAKIEQVVQARGKLEPQEAVKDVKPPINGVVKEVLVEDGDKVEKGDLLITFDSTASQAELDSLRQIRQSLTQENNFYRTLMDDSLSTQEINQRIQELNLPPEVVALSRNLTELYEENKMLNLYLSPEVTSESNLSAKEQARLNAIRQEYQSRRAAAELEMQQLEKQLEQNRLQLANAQAQLATDQQVLEEIRVRNDRAITEAENSLQIEAGILEDIRPLVEEGGLARLQLEQQKQSLSDRTQQVAELRANSIIEYNNQQQQVKNRFAEIDQLLEEQQRLQLDISQAQQELANTVALSEKDIRDQLANNQQRLADLESQLFKLVVENDKRIAETTSQISRAEQTLRYQELRAPVSGTIFDLQASPGFVPQPSQAEVLMKIVPDDHLIAKVYISNADIGFVQENLNADVRIDAFPFSEFGDIKGKLIWIGSDALPPDQIDQFYRFPAKIEMDAQHLEINDRQIPLQSGMSVSVNIKVREDRTVLSLMTELFTEKVESLKRVR